MPINNQKKLRRIAALKRSAIGSGFASPSVTCTIKRDKPQPKVISKGGENEKTN